MKKIVILFSFMLISMIITPSNSFAVWDCKMYCPEIDWQEDGMTQIQGFISNCRFEVYWHYRYVDCPELSHPWCDFKIDSIKCPSCTFACIENQTEYQLHQEISFKLLKALARTKTCFTTLPTVPPANPPENCTAFYSINKAACWTHYVIGTGGETSLTLLPCGDTVCCREVWKICKKFNGDMEDPEYMFSIGVNPICNPNLGCLAVCEEMPTPKNTLDKYENIESEFGDKAIVFTNSTNSLLNIRFTSESMGEHIFEVYDLNGNLVLIDSFQKQLHEENLQLNLNRLSSGNYNFVIKYGGKPSITGKFNIAK